MDCWDDQKGLRIILHLKSHAAYVRLKHYAQEENELVLFWVIK